MTALEISSNNGSITLSQYLDVEAGRGMEPGDPQFTEKIFAHSLLKQGATLALEDLKIKEMIFPLKLKAANKKALAELIQKINLIINTVGAQVRWEDLGASEPTYFDLASGQFDDEFNYWLGANNWLLGKLRLFVQPLGYRDQAKAGITQRVNGIATTSAIATGPVVVFQSASLPGGDGPAIIKASVGPKSGGISARTYSALSVLPHSEYRPLYPAASANREVSGAATTTTVATNNSIGGKFIRMAEAATPSYFTTILSNISGGAYQYQGANRVLAVARAEKATYLEIESSANQIATTPTINTTEWDLYDCGIFYFASSALTGGASFEVDKISTATTSKLDVAGLIILPENSTTFLRWSAISNTASTVWDGLSSEVFNTGSGLPLTAFNHTDLARGAIPQWYPGASAPTFAMLCMRAENNLNEGILGAANVLERTRYVF